MRDYTTIYAEACKAGALAGDAAMPNPMLVTTHASPLDDTSPTVRGWLVPEGVCGFAWVRVRDRSFNAFLRKHGYGRKAYEGGYTIWVSSYSQSMERKLAYASAFAEVLQAYSINAWPDSRMD